ncbi:MAG TPA: Mth938-like domain-containing protein [Casimicrobiaceae bacterium]|nr:Mth938-like domain-containing protein [Casimicrobiaceae bacterium]
MKLSLDSGAGIVVTGAGPGWIRVGTEEVRDNVVLAVGRVLAGFAPRGFDALGAADFASLLEHRPEVVIFGTGAVQRFIAPRTLAPLLDARVGVETMATLAACRTFNILSGEGRRVVAALIVREPD